MKNINVLCTLLIVGSCLAFASDSKTILKKNGLGYDSKWQSFLTKSIPVVKEGCKLYIDNSVKNKSKESASTMGNLDLSKLTFIPVQTFTLTKDSFNVLQQNSDLVSMIGLSKEYAIYYITNKDDVNYQVLMRYRNNAWEVTMIYQYFKEYKQFEDLSKNKLYLNFQIYDEGNFKRYFTAFLSENGELNHLDSKGVVKPMIDVIMEYKSKALDRLPIRI